jgi:hypothetical protein
MGKDFWSILDYQMAGTIRPELTTSSGTTLLLDLQIESIV